MKISHTIKKAIFFGLGAAFFAVPLVSSAASVTTATVSTVSASDLEAQIQTLLSQIQALQTQLNVANSTASTSAVTVTTTATPSCPSVSRSLSMGASGSDVTALQQFLSAKGYLTVSPTGYFGVLTGAAVSRWQAENNIAVVGSAGSGMFGPLSRAALLRSCGGTTSSPTNPSSPNQQQSFSAEPASGVAPLTTTFSTNASIGSTATYSVNFGDGQTGTMSKNNCIAITAIVGGQGGIRCSYTVSHTYASAGTYTASLNGNSCVCPANGMCNCPNMPILGSTTVTVTSGTTTPRNISLSQGGIAEIRNENFYFTLQSLSTSSATIQITPVGCWNSFPSDPVPMIRCMIAIVPIPPQTLSVGQTYNATNYSITLTQISNGMATFAVNTPPSVTPVSPVPTNTYGMIQYTDPVYGFSFWYPSALSILTSTSSDTTEFPGGVMLKTLQIGSRGGDTAVIVVDSQTQSITDEPNNHASPIAQTKYFYDNTSMSWMRASPDAINQGNSGTGSATTTADISNKTISGLPMLPASRRFDTTIIPVNTSRFIVVTDGGGSPFTTQLAKTVTQTGATVDASAQSSALQAEASAYAE